MVLFMWVLSVLFAIASYAIIKNKRYKAMPMVCLIIFISFIGFTTISVLSLVLPYGEFLIYPLGALIIGVISLLIGLNDVLSILHCTEEVEGVYCGYHTYYGGNGVSLQFPVFEYVYDGVVYHEQTNQNVSFRQLDYEMREGEAYVLYLNPKHPSVYILVRKIKASSIVVLLLGLFFLTFGIYLCLELLPMFIQLIS